MRRRVNKISDVPFSVPGENMEMKAPPGTIGTYHCHYDEREGDPNNAEHDPDKVNFSDIMMRPPSSPKNPAPGGANDIGGAQILGVPGIAVDRFYIYVYQADGCTWKFPHPCANAKDPATPIGDPERRE
jgi:hypothetical protein